MALKLYKKAPIRIHEVVEEEAHKFIEIPSTSTDRLTMGKLIGSFFGMINNLLISSRIVGFFFPLALIFFGGNIIYRQVWPDIEQTLRQWAGQYDNESVALVAGDYVERVKYVSDPGDGYFRQLATEASSSQELLPDEDSIKYYGKFSISIDALGLKSLPVVANVDSSSDGYLKILDKSLAHFKGTGLPISPINNNIVIYGHSASGDYYQRSKDVSVAFSELNKIKIGDSIKIDMDGKSYNFRVVKSKIVQPNDISILVGNPGRRTLTLFTCFPNGNNAQRFVVVANPIN